MKQTIDNASQFRDAFRTMGRHGNFSYDGMELLFDYLEELDPDYALDVIALCCEYVENSPEEVISSYGIDYDTDEPEALEAALAYLERNTSVVGVTASSTIVYCTSF